MTHAWQQRVVRLYDPDWHMIEVGESMEHIALRLLDEGRSVEETAALIHHPTDFVEQCRKGFEIDMFGYEPEFVVRRCPDCLLRCRPRKAACAAARQRRGQLVLERPDTRADPLFTALLRWTAAGTAPPGAAGTACRLK